MRWCKLFVAHQNKFLWTKKSVKLMPLNSLEFKLTLKVWSHNIKVNNAKNNRLKAPCCIKFVLTLFKINKNAPLGLIRLVKSHFLIHLNCFLNNYEGISKHLCYLTLMLLLLFYVYFYHLVEEHKTNFSIINGSKLHTQITQLNSK